MKRRKFIKDSSLIAASGLFPFEKLILKRMKKIGIQLFSLPFLLEKDFKGAIQMLSKMGYKEVELFGPFPFTASATKEQWKQITSALGFSKSGFFGYSPQELKTILKDNKIKVPAIHTDLLTLQTNMEQLGAAAQILGFKYAGIPSIPEDKRKTLDDYKRMADEFNKIGAAAKKVGIGFYYHNHGYGLQEMEGQIPLNLLLERTDPDLVSFEMDIYWTTAGGANPIDYLKAYPKRYRFLHLKDMKEKRTFSGDGGSPSQWMELFPYMTTAGDGVLDIDKIISVAKKTNVKYYFVEQDLVANPEVALKRSIDYLKDV